MYPHHVIFVFRQIKPDVFLRHTLASLKHYQINVLLLKYLYNATCHRMIKSFLPLSVCRVQIGSSPGRLCEPVNVWSLVLWNTTTKVVAAWITILHSEANDISYNSRVGTECHIGTSSYTNADFGAWAEVVKLFSFFIVKKFDLAIIKKTFISSIVVVCF